MMGLQVQHIARGVSAAALAMPSLEQVLNDADAMLGDGDTGSMLARMIGSMSKADLSQTTDVGLAFSALARAAMSSTGSSLGTLLATALLTLSQRTKGRSDVPWPEVGALLSAAREAMSARGGANLGDKTVLDALDAVAHAVGAGDQSQHLAATASRAAHAALARMKPLSCRVGRARMFPQKSAGADDPGMLAFALLLDALAADF